MALEDTKLPAKNLPKARTGVIIGTTIGEKPLEELVDTWVRGGLKEIDRQRVLQASVNISPLIPLSILGRRARLCFLYCCAAVIMLLATV